MAKFIKDCPKACARYAGIFVMTVFSGMLVWERNVQNTYAKRNPGNLDWSSPKFGRGFGLYIMLNTTGNLLQNYLVCSLRESHVWTDLDPVPVLGRWHTWGWDGGAYAWDKSTAGH